MKYLSKRFTRNYKIYRFILILLLSLLGSIPAVYSVYSDFNERGVYIIAGGYVLFALVFFILFYKKRIGLSFTKTIFLIVGGLISMFILSFLIDFLLGSGVETSKNQETIEALLSKKFSLALVADMVLFAPIVEEFAFREYLPGLLRRLFKRRDQDIKDLVSLIIADVVFSLMHTPTDLYSFLVYFGIGLVLALVRYFSNSLRLSFLVHATWNFISVVILYFAL